MFLFNILGPNGLSWDFITLEPPILDYQLNLLQQTSVDQFYNTTDRQREVCKIYGPFASWTKYMGIYITVCAFKTISVVHNWCENCHKKLTSLFLMQPVIDGRDCEGDPHPTRGLSRWNPALLQALGSLQVGPASGESLQKITWGFESSNWRFCNASLSLFYVP